MKIKYKIKCTDLAHFNVIFTMALEKCLDSIDYADFYNLNTFLKKIADKIYKNNFDYQPYHSLSVGLNEYKTLKKIIVESKIELHNSYSCLVIDFFNQCEKQIVDIEHKQNIFFRNFKYLLK